MQSFAPVVGHYRNSRRPLPSLLIIGAQRCGTTSLHRLLTSHPQVHPPRAKKGVHYFDLSYGKDLGWYRGAFPIVSAPDIVMETSPYYLFHPEVPARVAFDLPGVKAIALLRSPVDRAASHHHRETERGFETLSFEDALDAEEERLAHSAANLASSRTAIDHAHQHFAYAARGRYAEQLQRWFDAIGREQVLVLDSQRLFDNAAGALAEITSFLDISPFGSVEFPRVNGYERALVAPATRERLENYFAPHDALLTDLLGWSPSWC
jgi:hypothetical protein